MYRPWSRRIVRIRKYCSRSTDLGRIIDPKSCDIDWMIDKNKISEMLNDLPQKTRAIIVRRFGLEDTPAETLGAIGIDMGISGQRVRQRVIQAIRKLQHPKRSVPLEALLEYDLSAPEMQTHEIGHDFES